MSEMNPQNEPREKEPVTTSAVQENEPVQPDTVPKETEQAPQQESASPAVPRRPEKAVQPTFSVPGTITKSAYESIKKYLIPPAVKIVWIAVLVAEVLTGLYGIIFEHSYGSLVLMILMGGFLIFFYFHMQNSAIKNVLKNHAELRQHGYKVVISFGNGIRLSNLTTGVERNLAYKEIYSIVETDRTILCFAKKDKVHKHLMIPKDEMTEEQRQKVLDILHSRCGKLKKRW